MSQGFKSEAHRLKMYELMEKGVVSENYVKELEKNTKDLKLPKRVFSNTPRIKMERRPAKVQKIKEYK